MENEHKTSKGGKRPGAGRKPGSTTALEKTTVIRVPVSQKSVIVDLLQAYARRLRNVQQKDNTDPVSVFEYPELNAAKISRPLYQSKVPAGFPSPADDHIEGRVNPNEYLIDQEDSTFFVTIQGESMIEAGLLPGDKAVIDREKQPVIGNIVLAMIDGEFTIKILSKQKDGTPKLLPANSSGKYAPILIKESMQFQIFGVVTGSFRRFK